MGSMGEINEKAITAITSLGFERDQVVHALNANSNNFERTFEYLLNVSPLHCVMSFILEGKELLWSLIISVELQRCWFPLDAQLLQAS